MLHGPAFPAIGSVAALRYVWRQAHNNNLAKGGQ